ncbi:hypothetical protein ES703_91866 [subsurface metagenome]
MLMAPPPHFVPVLSELLNGAFQFGTLRPRQRTGGLLPTQLVAALQQFVVDIIVREIDQQSRSPRI